MSNYKITTITSAYIDEKSSKVNECIYKEYGQMIEINYLLESNDTKAGIKLCW